MTDLQRQEFEAVTRPVIEWMNANSNPHAVVVIDTRSAVLYLGEIAYTDSIDAVSPAPPDITTLDAAVLAEREKCAMLCEDLLSYDEDDPGASFAKAIRTPAIASNPLDASRNHGYTVNSQHHLAITSIRRTP